ncbi:MAG: coproporphyrinogen-III oxidase family protein [Elusimicrobiota bacterium]
MTRTVDDAVFRRILRISERSNYTGAPNPYPALAAWDILRDDELVRRAWTGSRGADRGLYVHIPFCRSRCRFCFLPVWGAGDRGRVERYLRALLREAGIASGLVGKAAFRSVYVGGGTPTLLAPGDLERLFDGLKKAFILAPGCQIALEANPDTLQTALARRLKGLGVNWLTLGVQSLEDAVLKASGRTHTGRQAFAAYRAARAAGVEGINVDLLFGLPGQSPSGFLADVERVAAWRPDQIHLNTYVNAPGTALARSGLRVTRGTFHELLRAQESGFELLFRRGYTRIDADSAGLTADSVNWQGSRALGEGAGILGLGVVAVSYVPGRLRYVNTKDIGIYVDALERGRLPVERGIELSPDREMRHFLLNALEHGGVIRKGDFRRIFGVLAEREFGEELERLKKKGVLREDADSYRLTDHPGGIFEYSRNFYEPGIIEKIANRYRLQTTSR